MENIRIERARYNMSMQQLADEIGVGIQTVFNWEHGRCEPKATQIAKMSRVFGCSADYLLGLTKQRRWR